MTICIRILAIIIISIWVSGCVNPTKFPLSTNNKVGIMLGYFPSELTHTHIGVSGFNNYNKTYPATVNFREYSGKKLVEYYKKQGMDAVVIDASLDDIKLVTESVKVPPYQNMAPHFDKEKGKFLTALKEKYKVDVLLVINTEVKNMNSKPDLLNGSPFNSGAYGIFSTTNLGFDDYFYYYYFPIIRIVNLDPPRMNAVAKPIGYIEYSSIKLDSSDDITAKEMQESELEIKNSMDRFLSRAVQFSISGSSYEFDRECNCDNSAGF